jgi:hypothetical protein
MALSLQYLIDLVAPTFSQQSWGKYYDSAKEEAYKLGVTNRFNEFPEETVKLDMAKTLSLYLYGRTTRPTDLNEVFRAIDSKRQIVTMPVPLVQAQSCFMRPDKELGHDHRDGCNAAG